MDGDSVFSQLTAYENSEFYTRVYGLKSTAERGERIREVIELAGLNEAMDVIVGYFSRGMRRRLALARALIHSSDIIFFYEPTLGLDVEVQALMRDLITKVFRKNEVTVILHMSSTTSER